MFLTTEDSNEAIDRGEMVETPPGSQATACCSKDYAGTWENLSFPKCRKVHSVCIGQAGLRGPADQNPTWWRKEWREQQGEEEATSIQTGRSGGEPKRMSND